MTIKMPNMKTVEGPKLDFKVHLNTKFRDFFWNHDFLHLMQQRLKLTQVKTALDVGCGLGHWTRTILPHLHPDAEIIGVDNNKEWVTKAPALKNIPQATFKEGDAYALPFDDAHFDMVTCQTLMMHLGDPGLALKEMYRVLKPGGVLFLAEPNNYANLAHSNSAQAALTLEERLQIVQMYSIIEEGKRRCHEGFVGINWQLPYLISQAGFHTPQIFRNDELITLLPPYKHAKDQAVLEFLLTVTREKYFHIFPRDVAHKYFKAVYDDPALFSRLMATSDKLCDIYQTQIKNKTFKGSFTGEMVIVTGMK